jgi:long-subunit fatty acid transport protein
MYRLGKLGLALDSRMLRMPAYGGVSDNGSEIRDTEFSPSELSVSAGASYSVLDFLSVGLALRYADSKLAEDASSAVFGADVALYFKKNGIKAGLSVNNLCTKVKFLDRAYSQPMMAKLGAGYDLTLGNSALDFMAEVDVLFSGSLMAGAGCEYSFNEMVYVRAGYHYGSSVDVVPSYASAGLGISIFGAKLNVAYLFGSRILANSMCFSLGYSF